MQNLFINIRDATENDLPTIMQIEDLCFSHGAWKEENILYELKDNPVSHFWVIELALNEGDAYQVVGFCDSFEITSFLTIMHFSDLTRRNAVFFRKRT